MLFEFACGGATKRGPAAFWKKHRLIVAFCAREAVGLRKKSLSSSGSNQAREGRLVDALAVRGDEGRDTSAISYEVPRIGF